MNGKAEFIYKGRPIHSYSEFENLKYAERLNDASSIVHKIPREYSKIANGTFAESDYKQYVNLGGYYSKSAERHEINMAYQYKCELRKVYGKINNRVTEKKPVFNYVVPRMRFQ